MGPCTTLAVTFEGLSSELQPLTEIDHGNIEYDVLNSVLAHLPIASIYDVKSLELKGKVVNRPGRRQHRRSVNGFIMSLGFTPDMVSIGAAVSAAEAISETPIKLACGSIFIASVTAEAYHFDDTPRGLHMIFSTLLFWLVAILGSIVVFYVCSVALGNAYYGFGATMGCACFAVFVVEREEEEVRQGVLEAEEIWREMDEKQMELWKAAKTMVFPPNSEELRVEERQRDEIEEREAAAVVAERSAHLERSLRERLARLEQLIQEAETSGDESPRAKPTDEQASGGDDCQPNESTLRRRTIAAPNSSLAADS